MSGKTVRIFTVSTLLMAGVLHASAQTAEPTENVTITATKSREVFDKFTKTFATATKFAGKIARWERGVCPLAVGESSHFNTFVAQRVKYMALAAGAPVDSNASCTPNIEIVFTTTPQALLDNIRLRQSDFLGYADSHAQDEKLAMVTRPIQAWYTTETKDLHGIRRVDTGTRLNNGTISNVNFSGDALTSTSLDDFPPTYASTGNHIDDGMRSGFNHIVIVIDSTKVAGQKIVPLADYISMLALTQLDSLDACQQLPSIVNMLAAECGHAAVDGMTQFDLAYLQGLYRMTAGRRLMMQRNEIADSMAEKHLNITARQ